MALKLSTSRSLGISSSHSDLDLEGVNMPAAGPTGGDIHHQDMNKINAPDRLAMGGMSALDKQAMLADPLLSMDLREVLTGHGQSAAPAIEAPPLAVDLAQQDHAARAKQHAINDGFDLSHEHTPHAPQTFAMNFGAPEHHHPSGSLGHPEGFMPEGFMGPQGLISAQRGWGENMPEGLLKPAGGGQHQAPQQPQQQQHSESPSAQQSQKAEQAHGPEANTALSEQVQKHFQPVQQLKTFFPNLWQKAAKSPFLDLLSRLLKLILALFGFSDSRGYRGGRPELGRD